MNNVLPRWSASISLAILLSACGGGGGGPGIVSTPTPIPSLPPTPIPSLPPTPTGPLLDAVQPNSPSSPVASAATPNFSALGQTTVFPMLMTAVNGSWGGDSATTSAGATLTANTNGTYQLTVNNSAVGATNVLAASYPGTVVGVTNYVTEVVAGNLDYLRFGYWYKYQPSEGVFTAAAWTAGYVTPSSDIPVQGTATFTGTATGLVSDYVACNCGDAFLSTFIGQSHVTANFAALSLTGSVDNIILSSPLGQARGPMNDIAFTATIDRLNNVFSGTTSVSSQPGGAWAFGQTANGHINGRFYGRNAREIGAVFGLSDGARRLIGSFGAKQP